MSTVGIEKTREFYEQKIAQLETALKDLGDWSRGEITGLRGQIKDMELVADMRTAEIETLRSRLDQILVLANLE